MDGFDGFDEWMHVLIDLYGYFVHLVDRWMDGWMFLGCRQ